MPRDDAALPTYSYVPRLWPHPHSHPEGHRFGPPFAPAQLDNLTGDPTFLLGVRLFDVGYYWEAHEAWEHLWHAAGRSGATATLLKGLIQLAVVGVKVRERRADGGKAHARRAVELLSESTSIDCGLDLRRIVEHAKEIATSPPAIPKLRQPVEILWNWRLSPLASESSPSDV